MLLPVVVFPFAISTSNGLLLLLYYYYYATTVTIILLLLLLLSLETSIFSARGHSLRHYYVAVGSTTISPLAGTNFLAAYYAMRTKKKKKKKICDNHIAL